MEKDKQNLSTRINDLSTQLEKAKDLLTVNQNNQNIANDANNKEINDLFLKIKQGKEINENVTNQNTELLSKVNELNKVIDDKNQEINNLTNKLNDLTNQNFQLRSLNSAEDNNNNADLIIEKNKEIARLNTELNDAKVKIQSLSAINPSLKEENNNLLKENTSLKEANKILKNKSNHLEMESIHKNDSINVLTERNKNLESENKKLNDNLEETTSKLNNITELQIETKQELDDEKEVNKLLGSQISKLETENSKLQELYKKANEDLNKANTKILFNDLFSNDDEFKKVKDENAFLKEENKKLKFENETKNKQLNVLDETQLFSNNLSVQNLLANPTTLLKTCKQLMPTSRRITVAYSSYFDSRHPGHPRFLYFNEKMYQVGSWEQITRIICDGLFESYGTRLIDAIWSCKVGEIYSGLTVENKSDYHIYFANQSQNYNESFTIQISYSKYKLTVQYKASAVMRLIRFIYEKLCIPEDQTWFITI